MLSKAITYNPNLIKTEAIKDEDNKGLKGFLDFSSDMIVKPTTIVEPTETILETKKKGRKKKDQQVDSQYFPAEEETKSSLPAYKDGYEETNNMLKTAIVQLDIANNDLDKDLSDIRSSKTLRKKYDYIADLVATKSSVIQSKITAIREINSTTTKAYELELRRAKEQGTGEVKDDDRMIMDMYNSMITIPYAGNNQAVLPDTSMGTFNTNQPMMYKADYDPNGVADAGYMNYVQNMTPEQNLYRYENDPNVEQVIMFDPETGNRKFAYIDKRTNQEIANLPTLPEFLMEEFTLNPAQGIARSSNLGQSLPIIQTSLNPLKASKY